jgi:Ca2+-binding EF-hand superfamily protein
MTKLPMTKLPFLAATATAILLASCQTAPDHFAAADLDGDGKLSRDEAHEFIITKIFEQRDANKDGKISLAEWSPNISAEDRDLFQVRDANKDGFVSFQEARAYSKKHGTWNSIFDIADTNKDGFISRKEAAVFRKNHPEFRPWHPRDT